MAAPSSAEQFLLSDWNSLSFPEIEECSLIGEQLYKHCQIERSINGRKRKSSEARGAHLREREEKEMSQEDESPKQEYIHVRAKRGHATNSHSLAERVRREKISERMKVLQDLVPGCNKITGKAVMLDEIINYVQSLQKQVEFLSMKLAAVHPELKVDIEQIFSRDIRHQAWENTATILGLGSGLRAQYQHFHGAGQMQSEEVMMHQISSMSQLPNVWDEELQDAMDMVFIHHHKQ